MILHDSGNVLRYPMTMVMVLRYPMTMVMVLQYPMTMVMVLRYPMTMVMVLRYPMTVVTGNATVLRYPTTFNITNIANIIISLVSPPIFLSGESVR